MTLLCIEHMRFIAIITLFFSLQIGRVGLTNDTAPIVSGHSVTVVYPITSDASLDSLKNTPHHVNIIYPLLVVNGIVIRDRIILDKFRNTIKRSDIKHIKVIERERAMKIGLTEVPDYGAVLITLRKNCIFEIEEHSISFP